MVGLKVYCKWWKRFSELEDNLQNSINIKTKQQNKNKKNSNDL